MTAPRTLFQKIWDAHVVAEEPGAPAILYIDRHLVHEVTSPQAFTGLRARGLKVRRPELTFATADHSVPTKGPVVDEEARKQLEMLEANAKEFGVSVQIKGSPKQGVVHIIGPEQGLTLPGMTIVCGDSHTATHGAFGAPRTPMRSAAAIWFRISASNGEISSAGPLPSSRRSFVAMK